MRLTDRMDLEDIVTLAEIGAAVDSDLDIAAALCCYVGMALMMAIYFILFI
jgi:hypothetical protein